MLMMNEIKEVGEALKELDLFLRASLDSLDLECDAHSYVVSCILNKAKIKNTRVSGYVLERDTDRIVIPHVWTLLGDEHSSVIIDYQLTRWLVSDHEDSNAEIPDGIFYEFHYENTNYIKDRVLTSDFERDVLIGVTEERFDAIAIPEHLVKELKLEFNL